MRAAAIATGSPQLLVPLPSSDELLSGDRFDMKRHTCLPNAVAGGNDDDEDDDTEATRHKLSRYDGSSGIVDTFVTSEAAVQSIA